MRMTDDHLIVFVSTGFIEKETASSGAIMVKHLDFRANQNRQFYFLGLKIKEIEV